MNKNTMAVAGLVLLALVAGAWYLGSQQTQPIQTQPVAVTPEPSAPRPTTVVERSPEPARDAAESEPALLAPPASIDDSLPVIQQLVASLSPDLLDWLVDEELLRKFVILVDQLADGDLSRKHLPLDYPMPAFAILGDKDNARTDPQNFHRAKPLIAAVLALEPALLVTHYRRWQPLLNQAYSELGKPGKFDDRLMLAIRNLQQIPPAPLNAALVARPVVYKYQDPKREDASALHKWMWRLGADNQARINDYLTQLKVALYQQP